MEKVNEMKLRLTPAALMEAYRVLSDQWSFRKRHPLPEDKPEDLQNLKAAADEFYRLTQAWCD